MPSARSISVPSFAAVVSREPAYHNGVLCLASRRRRQTVLEGSRLFRQFSLPLSGRQPLSKNLQRSLILITRAMHQRGLL
jgi:hypothetical protein